MGNGTLLGQQYDDLISFALNRNEDLLRIYRTHLSTPAVFLHKAKMIPNKIQESQEAQERLKKQRQLEMETQKRIEQERKEKEKKEKEREEREAREKKERERKEREKILKEAKEKRERE